MLNTKLAGSDAMLFKKHAVEGLATPETGHETNFFCRIFRFCAQHALSIC